MHRNSQQQLSCAHLTKQKSLPMGYLGSNLVSFTASILFFPYPKSVLAVHHALLEKLARNCCCRSLKVWQCSSLGLPWRKKKAKICRFPWFKKKKALFFCHVSVSRYTFFATALGGWCPGLIGNSVQLGDRTLDGWNPAPVDRHFIPLLAGFYTSQVVVLDFFHQQ